MRDRLGVSRRAGVARRATEVAAMGTLVVCLAIVLMPGAERIAVRSQQLSRIDELMVRSAEPAAHSEYLSLSAPSARTAALPLAVAYGPGGDAASPLAVEPVATVEAESAHTNATYLPGFELDFTPVEPELASWGNVGGCGVGGGGGGGGLRWMGRRAPGGIIEVEFMNSYTAGEDLTSYSLTTKLKHEILAARLDVSLSFPYIHNTREDAYFEEEYRVDKTLETEGMGDISLNLSRTLGMTGDTNVGLTIGLPTAEHDKQVYDYYLPSDAQIGKGVLTYAGTAEHTINFDWGMLTLGTGLNLNGGENDIGNRTGDSYDGYAYLGYRTEGFVHSVGIKISRSLKKDMNAGVFAEDQSRTNVTLQYGLEFSMIRMSPIFIGITHTIGENDSANSTGFGAGVVMSF